MANGSVYREWHGPKCTSYGFYADVLKQQNVLIGGTTGSGKSVLIRGLINEIMTDCPNTISCVLIDPKKVDLRRFANIPHCIGYASEHNEIYNLLSNCHSLMMDRFNDAVSKGLYESDKSHVYIIVDEFADLIMDSKYGKKIQDILQSLAQLGRAAHIHLILATQAPSRQVIKAEIAVNMTAQIALRCRSAIESRQIIGDSGAEKLPRFGKCYYYTPEFCRIVGVDVPFIDDNETNRRINHWLAQYDRQNIPTVKTAAVVA